MTCPAQGLLPCVGYMKREQMAAFKAFVPTSEIGMSCGPPLFQGYRGLNELCVLLPEQMITGLA